MDLRHGHIYFVEFDPSSGHEFQKMRPAVILSSDELMARSNLATCVPFTSSTDKMRSKDDILVKKDDENHLYMDSVLKTQHISSFDKGRVKKYVGILDSISLKTLKATVNRNFDLLS
jgi:mRNA interferase MazF